MSMVHTARGTGRIAETETVRGHTSYRVVGIGFDDWFPQTKVHIASPEDGWTPIGDESNEYHDPYSEAGPVGGMPPADPGMGDPMAQGFDGDFTDALGGLEQFAQTGEVPPEAMTEFSGSPDPETILGYRLAATDYSKSVCDRSGHDFDEFGECKDCGAKDTGSGSFEGTAREGTFHWAGPGDNVDHDNSVHLPYNPDPQHDAVHVTDPDASWGPGEYTIDADERLHPSDSLTLNDVSESEAGPYPGPAPHLFAGALDSGDDWLGGDVVAPASEPMPSGQLGPGPESGLPGSADQMRKGHREAGAFMDLLNRLGEGDPHQYDAMDSRDWGHQDAERSERLIDPEDARQQLRDIEFGRSGLPGLDRAAALSVPRMDRRYVDIVVAADHWNDPVQMFRDDPHAFIQRRGSSYSTDDGELDRYAALLDSDRIIRQGSWRDVRQKAQRLRSEGKVTVKDISPDRIYASVQGDNGIYETLITKGSSLGGYDAYNTYGDQHVGNWHCSCKWGNWAFKRRFTFIGRLCSHGLASYWEMQAAHHNEDAANGRDPRRQRLRTRSGYSRRASVDVDPYGGRPVEDEHGLGYLIDHYGPHDRFDLEDDFSRRTHDTQDYSREQNALHGGDEDLAGLLHAFRRAEFLRTQPRGMTPELHHIPKQREQHFEGVDTLEDIDMLGASDQGTVPDSEAESSNRDREAAAILGKRIVAWIADEVLPDFEEWYAQNHGRQLDQARPTEASQAAADYAAERGLDQATTEMLQEFINQQFGPEDLHDDGSEETPEIKHFEMAAGRYLMAAVHVGAPGDPPVLPGFNNRVLPGFNDRPDFNWPPAPGTGTPPATGVLVPSHDSTQVPSVGAPSTLAPGTPAGQVPGQAGTAGGGAAPGGAASPGFWNSGAPKAPGANPGGGTSWGDASGGGGTSWHTPGGPGSSTPAGPGQSWERNTDTKPIGAGDYKVTQGDTLADIAQRSGYGGNYQDLAKANGITDPNKIDVGQSIKVGPPGGGGTSGEDSAPHGGTGAPPGPTAHSPASDTPAGNAGAGTGWQGGQIGTGTPTPPTTPSAPGMIGPAGGPAATPLTPPSSADKKTGRTNHILASDEALLNHLRELSTEPADDHGHMDERNDDVRHTVDELRDRGFDASQLVAMVRSAADGDYDSSAGASPYDWSDDPKNPANHGQAKGVAHPSPGTAPVNGAPAKPLSAPAAAPAVPVSAPVASGGSGGMLTAQPDASKNPAPSAEQSIGGTGESLPGGSTTTPGKAKSTEQEGSPSSGTGGIGADFMNSFGDIASGVGSGIGSAMSGLSGLLSGGGGGGLSGLLSGGGGALSGLSGLSSGLGGILGAHFGDGDDEDNPLLGEEGLEFSTAPGGFAGTGPDHQHWTSSAEDYIDKHEKQYHEDINSFNNEDSITKYSSWDAAWKEAMSRQANAFDNYADWAYATSDGSANPDDWDSVESFIDEAEDRMRNPQDSAPARKLIRDHLDYTAAMGYRAMMGAAASPAGYFGVGADPRLPTADGLSHSNGAPNLRAVTKPKKVSPPLPPNLQPMPPAQPQLAKPVAPHVQPGGFAPQQPATGPLGKPKRTTGGISRQTAQLESGTIAPVFGQMGSTVGFDPGPSEYVAAIPSYGGGFSGVPGEQVSPEQRLGGFGWDPLPGQDGTPNEVARQGPPDTFGAHRFTAHLSSMQPQYVEHNQQIAAAMGEYRTPNPGSYGRTDDSSEVVRQFQAAMGGGDWHTGGTPTGVPSRDYDLSVGANQFLARTAGRNYSLAEQARLEQESHVLGARNLDELNLSGTHYLEQ